MLIRVVFEKVIHLWEAWPWLFGQIYVLIGQQRNVKNRNNFCVVDEYIINVYIYTNTDISIHVFINLMYKQNAVSVYFFPFRKCVENLRVCLFMLHYFSCICKLYLYAMYNRVTY